MVSILTAKGRLKQRRAVWRCRWRRAGRSAPRNTTAGQEGSALLV